MNYFEELNKVNCSDKIEKKNGLSYLSWAWAWGELKKRYPKSYYTVYENKDGWNYFSDGKTAWVKTGVTVVTEDGSIEHIEYLPVMDFRNKSITLENITSFDVNKTIQRSLTKAVARHGLGLYIYAGEDLPEDAEDKTKLDKALYLGIKPEEHKVSPLVDKASVDALKRAMEEKGVPEAKILDAYGVLSLGSMTKEQWISAMRRLDKTKCKQESTPKQDK